MLVLLAAVLAIAAGALFSVQNAARTTQLSFDLGFAAWRLEEPLPVPVLMALCCAGGLLLGLAVAVERALSLTARIHQLESPDPRHSRADGASAPSHPSGLP